MCSIKYYWFDLYEWDSNGVSSYRSHLSTFSSCVSASLTASLFTALETHHKPREHFGSAFWSHVELGCVTRWIFHPPFTCLITCSPMEITGHGEQQMGKWVLRKREKASGWVWSVGGHTGKWMQFGFHMSVFLLLCTAFKRRKMHLLSWNLSPVTESH